MKQKNIVNRTEAAGSSGGFLPLRKVSWLVLLPFLVLQILLLCRCGQLPDYRSFTDVDLKPPVLLRVVPRDSLTVEVVFDEPLGEFCEVVLSPGNPRESWEVTDCRLEVRMEEPQVPGKVYTLEGQVRDLRGNSLSFLHLFYGHNPSPPRMLINEFTTQGSAAHPDVVELRVIEPGNCAGMALCEGTTDTYKDRYVFPPVEVRAGEYLLVHFKPQGIPGEINETGEALDESAGLDASPSCRDFWVPGGDGLAGNNGVIALYSFPQGPLMDGVLYSNRTSSSDEKYRGFGTQDMVNQADQLYLEGGWKIRGGEIAPEDGVDPSSSTATRSLCRNSAGDDTDSAADWHTVPTGAYSFGRENSDAVYSP